MRIMQYGRVISELRKIEHMKIENRTQFKDGTQYSWFRWIPEMKVQREMEFVKENPLTSHKGYSIL